MRITAEPSVVIFSRRVQKSPLKEGRVRPDYTVEIAVKIITPLFESLFETKPNEPAGSVFALAIGIALAGGALEGQGHRPLPIFNAVLAMLKA
jgi:hypothetical protein